jgi:hypothetical protein
MTVAVRLMVNASMVGGTVRLVAVRRYEIA